VQLVGLADGSAVAVKISDGGDRARMPATVKLLEKLSTSSKNGADSAPLSAIATAPVLGAGRQVGLLQATDFLTQKSLSTPVNEAP